ncbi:MAG: 2-hydroxyacyl-CoA dehydratase subunit D, partial [Deferrisomatales bacterium]
MSYVDPLLYHWHVNVLGKTGLRYQRRRAEQRARRRAWTHEHLAPPLATSPWLKELISRHYLTGRHANRTRKVAWVTSGAPVEFLTALGYYLMYPENHAAVCGIRRQGAELCAAAEARGYSRDLCSYVRTDLGSVFTGQTPVGRLPRPDLLVCCNNICQTVLYWYQVLAHHFKVPLVLIDTPFVYDRAGDHAVAFVKAQLEEAIGVAERVAEQDLVPRRLEEVMALGRDAIALWLEVLETGRHRPSPITAFDEFIHMAPIVEMRGEAYTVEYYRALLRELRGRMERGEGALRREKKRLVWDNLPIWPQLRPLSETLAERGVALVASTYTNAWGELAPLIDPSRPLDSMARAYLHPILNRGTGAKLELLAEMVRSYGADGTILHSNRSCKPYSIGQVDQRRRLAQEAGVPALLLEADQNDPRVYHEREAAERLEVVFEC